MVYDLFGLCGIQAIATDETERDYCPAAPVNDEDRIRISLSGVYVYVRLTILGKFTLEESIFMAQLKLINLGIPLLMGVSRRPIHESLICHNFYCGHS